MLARALLSHAQIEGAEQVDLAKDDTRSVSTVVSDAMTARAFATRPGENYPAVLSTPILISELERVCADMLVPLLADGEVSVGVSVFVQHLAPTPVGVTVTSHARFVEQEGRIFWFDVWSDDPGGEIGRGKHGRALVRLSAIEARAGARRTSVAG